MYTKGFGFAPAAAAPIAAASGPLAPFVLGASIASSLLPGIGRLFGAAPRGQLQKFQRTLYPYMRTVAARSGVPVLCYWFGEIVEVKPDGSYAAVASNMTLSEAEGYWQSRIAPPFYIARCYRSDGDCVNNPADARFDLYDPSGTYQGPEIASEGPYSPTTGGGVIVPGSGLNLSSVFPTGGNIGQILAIVLIGGAVLLAMGRKGKK
jgi:hypothetical protein